jgi:hypothetical protein
MQLNENFLFEPHESELPPLLPQLLQSEFGASVEHERWWSAGLVIESGAGEYAL